MTKCMFIGFFIAIVIGASIADPTNVKAAEGYTYKPKHSFVVVAKNGQLDIERIFPEISINDLGVVAFIGLTKDSDGSGSLVENIFVTSTNANSLRNISPGLHSRTSPQISPGIQINDQDRVLVTRKYFERTEGTVIPFYNLETWDADGVDSLTRYLTGVPVPSETWQGISHYASIDNEGRVVFMGMATDGMKLGTIDPNPNGVNFLINLSGEYRRPRMADNNTLILRSGAAPYSLQLRRNTFNFGLIATIASSANGFTYVGQSPGISDDGNLVAFSGVLTTPQGSSQALTPGEGIFAYDVLATRLIRVAGFSDNGELDPGEFWNDTTRDGKFNKGTETDLGLISGLEFDAPVCLNNHGFVVFLGNDINRNKCIFASYVNRGNAAYPVADPHEVIAVGDTIAGLNGTLSDMALYDGAGGRVNPGEIAFWTKTSSGQNALVVAARQIQPLIVIPGMAASELAASDEQLWPSLFTPSNIRKLSLEKGNSLSEVHPTDVIRSVIGEDVHGQMLEMLVGQGGHRELVPDVSCHSPESCIYSLPASVAETSPSLFVFPYDWRISCAENAQRLRQYIHAIRALYVDAHVDLVAHSMGGLVARRYLIDHPDDHYVDKCITIGSPFLGAPIAYKRILKGDFFELPIIDPVNNSAITSILPCFRGFHELLPAPRYFELQGLTPFAEDGWDFNGNYAFQEHYSREQIQTAFDAQYSQHPVNWSAEFHSSEQDDWSANGFGVKYLHVVGVLKRDHTAIQARAREFGGISSGGDQPPARFIDLKYGKGDGTVPFVSAFRNSAMRTPGAKMVIVNGDGNGTQTPREYKDDLALHIGLTRNPRVHRALQYFLRTGERLWTDPEPVAPLARPAVQPTPTVDHREVLVVGFPEIYVKNPLDEDTTYAPGRGFAFPPDVTYSGDDTATRLEYPPTGTYEFRLSASKASVDIVLIEVSSKDTSANTVSVARFLDVSLKQGSSMRLVDTGASPLKLAIDEDSNGVADRFIEPSFTVSGPAAQDEQAPTLTAVRACHDGGNFLKLVGEDLGVGVDSIMYRGSGAGFLKYGSEIDAKLLSGDEILAFATDRAGNRSRLFRFPLAPSVKTAFFGGRVRISWEKTCWPFVLESSSSLAQSATWSAISLSVQDFGSENGVEIPSLTSQQFFRLRLSLR